jgi:hypothetical protein
MSGRAVSPRAASRPAARGRVSVTPACSARSAIVGSGPVRTIMSSSSPKIVAVRLDSGGGHYVLRRQGN